MGSMHTRMQTICKSTIIRSNPYAPVWWPGCQPASSKSTNGWPATVLKLNPTKTEVIWLGSHQRLKHCPVGELQIAGVAIKPTTHVRDLGVMIDNDLSLQCHVNHITRTCFYHLRQLRVIRRSLTVDTAHSLVCALVHSRLDYCNGVLASMHQYQYDRLQSVLRAAARLVLRLPKWASVSEAMRTKLHWLPYPKRVEFKLCSTIYKCLHNSAPQYLIELCVPVATLPGRCHLRSAVCGDLFVPATSTKTIAHWPSWIFLCWPSSLEQTTTCSKGPFFIIYNV